MSEGNGKLIYKSLTSSQVLFYNKKKKLVTDLDVCNNNNNNYELKSIDSHYELGIEQRGEDALVSETYTSLPFGALSPMEGSYIYHIIA